MTWIRLAVGLGCPLLFTILPVAPPSAADDAAFRYLSDGDERVLRGDSVLIDDVPYVSFSILIEQIGGAYTVLPTRVRVDFMGTTAWLTLDDDRVHALSIYSLRHPIRQEGNDVFIAVADVSAFFQKSFRARVEWIQPSAPEPEPAVTLIEPPASEEVAGAAPVERVGTPRGVIVIDPGHGGYDIGLEGAGGYQEKTLALDVAIRAKRLLEHDVSYSIVLTRNSDIGLTTAQRATLAIKSAADLVISLHAGGSISSRTSGVAVLYRPAGAGTIRALSGTRPGDAGPASEVQRGSRTLAFALSPALSEASAMGMRGTLPVPVRLLHQLPMPSVMIELGCLTNPDEENLLASESYRESLAGAIARGIVSYLNVPGDAQAGANSQTMTVRGPGL